MTHELRDWLYKDSLPHQDEYAILSQILRRTKEENFVEIFGEAQAEAQRLKEQRNEDEVRMEAEKKKTKILLSEHLEKILTAHTEGELLEISKSLQKVLIDDRKNNIPTFKSPIVSRTNMVSSEWGKEKRRRQSKHAQEALKLEASAERLRLKAAKDKKAEAEYAATLAEGKKFKTLQQAYANGDFIPVADEQAGSGTLRSNTGRRLGARGEEYR